MGHDSGSVQLPLSRILLFYLNRDCRGGSIALMHDCQRMLVLKMRTPNGSKGQCLDGEGQTKFDCLLKNVVT